MTQSLDAPDAVPARLVPDGPPAPAGEPPAKALREAAGIRRGAGALALGIGLVAFAAWATGHGAETQLSPAWAPVQPNTAIGLALLGVSLQLRRSRAAALIAGVVAAIGTVSSLEYLLDWDGGIDNLLIASNYGDPPGRMAFNTAIALTIGGIVLGTRGLRRVHPQVLATGGSLLSGLGLVALMGYASGLQGAYLWAGATAMAVLTALSILAVGVAAVAEARSSYQGGVEAVPGGLLPIPLGVTALTMSLVLWQVTFGKSGDTVALDKVSWVFLGFAVFLTSGFVLALQSRQSAVAARRRAEEAERALAVAALDLERSVVELQRSNRELEDFAYIASHDLQEPLRVVAGYVQLLERRYKGQLDDDADEFIGFAVDGANRMKRLIQDLLAYSRVGTSSHPFAPTDLQAVVTGSLAALGPALQESGGTVEVGALPTVPGDEVQLEQVVTNLLGNALKFAAPDRPPVVAVTAKRVDGGWEVSVADNGIGIPAQHRDRVFRMFQRLHGVGEYSGTGIGLAVVQKIVARHGGEIRVADTAGDHGTTICFTLPDLSPAQLGDAREPDPPTGKEPRT